MKDVTTRYYISLHVHTLFITFLDLILQIITARIAYYAYYLKKIVKYGINQKFIFIFCGAFKVKFRKPIICKFYLKKNNTYKSFIIIY